MSMFTYMKNIQKPRHQEVNYLIAIMRKSLRRPNTIHQELTEPRRLKDMAKWSNIDIIAIA